jgi:hypothetical protein
MPETVLILLRPCSGRNVLTCPLELVDKAVDKLDAKSGSG